MVSGRPRLQRSSNSVQSAASSLYEGDEETTSI